MNAPPDIFREPDVLVTIGNEDFPASLERGLAPAACAMLESMLPCSLMLIHARWSGEACWAPLNAHWPSGVRLAEESRTGSPQPGQILLYAGPDSEPELLFPYGVSRFACSAGDLAGTPVLTIAERLPRLAALGREILWGGAMTLRIDFSKPGLAALPQHSSREERHSC